VPMNKEYTSYTKAELKINFHHVGTSGKKER
jgi:hypothetical protein